MGDLFLILLLTSLMLVGAEYYAYRRLLDESKFTYDLVFHLRKIKTAESIQAGATLRKIDPLLGYAHDASDYERLPKGSAFENGFLDYNPNCQNCQRILTLGGSTTDGVIALQYYFNWPQALQNILSEKQHRVLNGGVGGFSTNQELIKLVRDGFSQKPKIVISFDGVNETFRSPLYPFLTEFEYNFYESFKQIEGFFPNFRAWMTRNLKAPDMIFYGVPSDLSDIDRWEQNIISMHALCKSRDLPYFAFLQPIYGVGPYVGTAEEQANFKNRGKLYRETINEFYSEAKLRCARLNFCYDISNIFDTHEGAGEPLYFDPRHPNTLGNQIIAERVKRTIEKVLNPGS